MQTAGCLPRLPVLCVHVIYFEKNLERYISWLPGLRRSSLMECMNSLITLKWIVLVHRPQCFKAAAEKPRQVHSFHSDRRQTWAILADEPFPVCLSHRPLQEECGDFGAFVFLWGCDCQWVMERRGSRLLLVLHPDECGCYKQQGCNPSGEICVAIMSEKRCSENLVKI